MINKAPRFKRRGPDILTLELASVLSTETWFEFKGLFLQVYSNLRARNGVSGGEEMLRLRAYDKLQGLVHDGSVKKEGKTYRGVASSLNALTEQAAEAASNLKSTAPKSASAAL